MISHFAVESNIIISTCVERNKCEASKNHVSSPWKSGLVNITLKRQIQGEAAIA